MSNESLCLWSDYVKILWWCLMGMFLVNPSLAWNKGRHGLAFFSQGQFAQHDSMKRINPNDIVVFYPKIHQNQTQQPRIWEYTGYISYICMYVYMFLWVFWGNMMKDDNLLILCQKASQMPGQVSGALSARRPPQALLVCGSSDDFHFGTPGWTKSGEPTGSTGSDDESSNLWQFQWEYRNIIEYHVNLI